MTWDDDWEYQRASRHAPSRYTPQPRGLSRATLAWLIVGLTLVVVGAGVGIAHVLNVGGAHSHLAPIPNQGKILAATLVTPGVLTWGGDATLGPPDVYVDPAHPNAVTGLEADVAQAVAQRLHLRAQFAQVAWGQFPAALSAHKIDLFAGAVPAHAVPSGAALLSAPYAISSVEIVIRKPDTRFTDLASLAGHPVGVVTGDAGDALVAQQPNVQRVAFTQALPFEALAAGRIDAIVISAPLARWYVSHDALQRFALALGDLQPEPLVIALPAQTPHAQDMQAIINETIDTMRCDGSLQKLLAKWDLTNDAQSQVIHPPANQC